MINGLTSEPQPNPVSQISGTINQFYQMDKNEFRQRTKTFAVNVAKFSNYTAACRAKSKADFVNKMRIVEEGDESIYFLELIAELYPTRK